MALNDLGPERWLAPHDGGDEHRLVVAVVDERQCSLAAIRAAMRHATGRNVRLLVVLRPRPLLAGSVLATHGLAFPPPDDRLAAELFAEAAVLLATCGRRWEFAMLPPGRTVHQLLAAGSRPGEAALLVTARHRHGAGRLPWLGDPALPRPDRADLLVALVRCDHPGPGAPAES